MKQISSHAFVGTLVLALTCSQLFRLSDDLFLQHSARCSIVNKTHTFFAGYIFSKPSTKVLTWSSVPKGTAYPYYCVRFRVHQRELLYVLLVHMYVATNEATAPVAYRISYRDNATSLTWWIRLWWTQTSLFYNFEQIDILLLAIWFLSWVNTIDRCLFDVLNIFEQRQ